MRTIASMWQNKKGNSENKNNEVKKGKGNGMNTHIFFHDDE
jgi:hypothetical protein